MIHDDAVFTDAHLSQREMHVRHERTCTIIVLVAAILVLVGRAARRPVRTQYCVALLALPGASGPGLDPVARLAVAPIKVSSQSR